MNPKIIYLKGQRETAHLFDADLTIDLDSKFFPDDGLKALKKNECKMIAFNAIDLVGCSKGGSLRVKSLDVSPSGDRFRCNIIFPKSCMLTITNRLKSHLEGEGMKKKGFSGSSQSVILYGAEWSVVDPCSFGIDDEVAVVMLNATSYDGHVISYSKEGKPTCKRKKIHNWNPWPLRTAWVFCALLNARKTGHRITQGDLHRQMLELGYPQTTAGAFRQMCKRAKINFRKTVGKV